jgi:hypothetical protein
MSKIVVNLIHSFHFEDLTQIEELMRKDGYANTLSIHTVEELYQGYAEEIALKTFLNLDKQELEEGLSIVTEIL